MSIKLSFTFFCRMVDTKAAISHTCAARPPAPWQHGMAPNQAPTMFMSPTLTDTSTGCAGRAGNRSALSWHTATTLLSVVTGSCGIPVKMMPVAELSLSVLTGQ